MHLFDVNVLIALLDSGHSHHLAAKRFFKKSSPAGWATCPLTENGVLRILGHPSYPGGTASTGEARVLLSSLTSMPGHQFWPDDLSLLQEWTFAQLPASKHLTDFYLLALAVARRGHLVTFDGGINPTLVKGGTDALHLLQP